MNVTDADERRVLIAILKLELDDARRLLDEAERRGSWDSVQAARERIEGIELAMNGHLEILFSG